MLKKIILLCLLLFLPSFASDSWQTVTVSDTVVDFGTVSAYEQHSLQLTLFNNDSQAIRVLNVSFEENEFSTDLEPSTIPAHSSRDFHIYFESDQNVNFTDFLRIDTDPGSHSIIVACSAENEYQDTYYRNTQNLWGADLKTALHNIIKGQTQLSYSRLWDALSDTDEDPDNPNNVILLYTGWSYSKANHGGNVDQWNREHVWAKSHGNFGTSPPAGTDVHHIRPTDVSVNAKRGSLDFDMGGNLYTDGDGPTECRYDNDSWEPRDAVKGDVARMLYYMVVRYEGDDTSYDLELVDFTPSTTSKEPLFGKQSTLYEWHWSDPVDAWERRRNDRIYNHWQHNRNPFIDHPEFTDRLPSLSGIALTSEPEIAVSPLSVDMGDVAHNTTAIYSIAVINTGNQNLSVSSVESTSPDFLVTPTSFTLVPETYSYLRVSFTSGQTDGDYTTTIRIHSNDPDEALVEVPVTVHVSLTAGLPASNRPPQEFKLSQNYPNPFGGRIVARTVIRYTVGPLHGKRVPVHLTVYTALGQKVRDLVNQLQYPGAHSVIFNASGLVSGVYYYKLQTGNFIQVRKMILLR